jgi:hypothetical protein
MDTNVLQKWAKTQGADARCGDLAGWMNMVQFGTLGVGKAWFVKNRVNSSTAVTDTGSDGNNGTSFATAFKTIAHAVAMASAGDTIFLLGTGFDEAVTMTVTTKRGIKLVGAGIDPSDTVWTYSTADGSCLTINASHVTVTNIDFKPPTYTAGTPAAITLGTGASYATITRNRFQGQAGSYFAIYSPVVGADNVKIVGNKFMYMNNVTTVYGTAIKGVSTGGFAYSGWDIENNEFNSCSFCIALNAKVCRIVGNVIKNYGVPAAGGAVAAILQTSGGIDLRSTSGAGGGANTVVGNYLGGVYSATLYKVNADVAGSDNWNGNYAISGTGVTSGVTFANPA